MIEKPITFDLPKPWSEGKFETALVGPINYLVGPNGSGKSRFAAKLFDHFKAQSLGVRLLGTDRLREMSNPGHLGDYNGDSFATGYPKEAFSNLQKAGEEGSGIDTLLLLEDKMNLRIQVEATLSHLFNRELELDWDYGNLVPKIVWRKNGDTYRLDRDECHGIKELFVLLTHLYDDQNDCLIIDEPELNLHPQNQAFFMQEVRKVAGKSKVVFLITHSPDVLDFRSADDIKSVISFDLKYSIPRQVMSENLDDSLPFAMIQRLNADHKQLFFSDNPIFVEGRDDALIVEALLEARGVSVAAAGNCIIDCGGVAKSTSYLKLCHALGKRAHFIFDLDSLFGGQHRMCIGDDDSIQILLTAAGLGGCFTKYIGELDQHHMDLIKMLRSRPLSGDLEPLQNFLCQLGENKKRSNESEWARGRVAVMTAIDRYRDAIVSEVTPKVVENITGRWQTILTTLKSKNILVLPGGTIERYLPSYSGNPFSLDPERKREAVEDELELLRQNRRSDQVNVDVALERRYGELYKVVCQLPFATSIDYDRTLRIYLNRYVDKLIEVVERYPDWEHKQIDNYMRGIPPQQRGVFSLEKFHRGTGSDFNAIIGVPEIPGGGRRSLDVDQDTSRKTIANRLGGSASGHMKRYDRRALAVEELSTIEFDAICNALAPAGTVRYNDKLTT